MSGVLHTPKLKQMKCQMCYIKININTEVTYTGNTNDILMNVAGSIKNIVKNKLKIWNTIHLIHIQGYLSSNWFKPVKAFNAILKDNKIIVGVVFDFLEPKMYHYQTWTYCGSGINSSIKDNIWILVCTINI